MFGVCCEAIPEQVNYLIDECMDTGKGANTVISYLHHYLQNQGIRAHKIHLNADNCTGQNKNNALMQYLAWRVLTGLNKSIKISFLPVATLSSRQIVDSGFLSSASGRLMLVALRILRMNPQS